MYVIPPYGETPVKESATLDVVNHPDHYRSHPSGIEVIQITKHMGFVLGNVIKYVMRADHKGNRLQDLQKARWYLDLEIADEEKKLDSKGV